jgi:rhamnulokinase
MRRCVAFDLGATSGRVMVAEVGVDDLRLEEVHRFPNGGVRHEDGSLRWNIERIYDEMLVGLRRAAESGPVDSIGIDSWAIDYGLVDADGRLLGSPYSHRDSRTDGVREKVVAEVGEEELYAVTGIQQLPFNTLYQLVAARDSAEYADAEALLLLPDLLASWLTGQRVAERTNASTTQFFDARSREWAAPLLERLGLRTDLLPSLVDPGEVIGTLTAEVADTVGLPAETPVIAVGSHDTASAVVGVPSDDEAPSAYISSGTWSLAGLELPAPILSEEARSADFTNEAGVDGTVRFLKNVTGLWVLSECVRQWGEEGQDVELETLLRDAAAEPALRSVVDVNDASLLPPDDMCGRLVALAERAGEPVPETKPQFTRLVLDSLALAYRRTVRAASTIANVRPEVVHVVGGGSQNELLCQLTADACDLPVVAGPTEAAALGNVLVQARALGEDLPDLAAMRALLRRTQALTGYEPGTTSGWDAAEERLSSNFGS